MQLNNIYIYIYKSDQFWNLLAQCGLYNKPEIIFCWKMFNIVPPDFCLGLVDYYMKKNCSLSSLAERRTRDDLIESFRIIYNLFNCNLRSLFILNDKRRLRRHALKLTKKHFRTKQVNTFQQTEWFLYGISYQMIQFQHHQLTFLKTNLNFGASIIS